MAVLSKPAQAAIVPTYDWPGRYLWFEGTVAEVRVSQKLARAFVSLDAGFPEHTVMAVVPSNLYGVFGLAPSAAIGRRIHLEGIVDLHRSGYEIGVTRGDQLIFMP